jgi:hypothetical protein
MSMLPPAALATGASGATLKRHAAASCVIGISVVLMATAPLRTAGSALAETR